MSFMFTNRYKKEKGPAFAAHAEDSQPNESINKRQAIPSLVVPSKQQFRADSQRGFHARGRGWGRGVPFTVGHAAYRPSARNSPHSVSTPSPGPTNSEPRRVPAGVSNASRQRITHDSTEAVIVRPNPSYDEPLRASARVHQTSASSNIHPQNAPPAQPTIHNSVSPVQTAVTSPPPLKRRRIDTVEVPPSVLPPRTASPSPAPVVRIKQEERTPSPPPANSSRLSATSGSQRYWPVPANCKRAFDPEFDTNRREWLHRECDKLKDLGLKVVKYFFRDDGMVIEWVTRNGEPVWLDSLPDGRQIIDLDGEDPSDNVSALPLPVATPPQSAVAADPEIIDVDASDAVPSPPRLSPPSPIAGPSNPPPDTIPEAQLTEEDLEQLSLDFIEQYVRTFDRNRDALAAAYSEDATISFRYNCSAFPIDSTHSTFQRKGSQSKAGSMPKLPLENYRFSPHRGDFYIDYEVVVIEPEPPVTVLLSAHGEFFGERAQTRMAFDQTFLLRRGGASEAWPLVAISHQIIVRDTPWVRWTGDLSDFTAQHVTLLS